MVSEAFPRRGGILMAENVSVQAQFWVVFDYVWWYIFQGPDEGTVVFPVPVV